jgi:hypothetical protein
MERRRTIFPAREPRQRGRDARGGRWCAAAEAHAADAGAPRGARVPRIGDVVREGRLGVMSLRSTILLATLGTAVALTLLLATHEWGFGRWQDGSVRFRFLLEDESDRTIYEQRGRWLPSGRTPYLQEHSEYPQLATWLFAAPYLFFDSDVPVGRAQTAAEFRNARDDHAVYGDLHHVSMAIGLWLLLALTALNLRALGHSPSWALLLFLPGTLYFAFNRFDAWPAAAVAGALLLQWRGRRHGAAMLLAVGAMLKWFPILLLPMFLAYNLHSRDGAGAGRSGARGLLARLPSAVILPGLSALAVCLAILGVTWMWDRGGREAVEYVYRNQMGRDPNPPSIVAALTVPGRWGLFTLEDEDWLSRAFMLLQFLPAVLLALLPIRTRRALLLGCLTVVLGFMQFGKVFSPQWICWVTPLAVLLAPRSLPCLLLLVAAELATYVQNPVIFYEAMGMPGITTRGTPAFWAACDTRIAVLFAFWAWSFAAFLRTVLLPAPALKS